MIGVGFWTWFQIELESLAGRPFAGWTIDLDAPAGDWLDVDYAQGPNRQYTLAQVYAFVNNRYPGVWVDASTFATAIEEAFRTWVLDDGTPPPEGGWTAQTAPRVRTCVRTAV